MYIYIYINMYKYSPRMQYAYTICNIVYILNIERLYHSHYGTYYNWTVDM